MIEKIKSGVAKLLTKRLCDIVSGNGEPTSIEQISYNEYEEIKPYIINK